MMTDTVPQEQERDHEQEQDTVLKTCLIRIGYSRVANFTGVMGYGVLSGLQLRQTWVRRHSIRQLMYRCRALAVRQYCTHWYVPGTVKMWSPLQAA